MPDFSGGLGVHAARSSVAAKRMNIFFISGVISGRKDSTFFSFFKICFRVILYHVTTVRRLSFSVEEKLNIFICKFERHRLFILDNFAP